MRFIDVSASPITAATPYAASELVGKAAQIKLIFQPESLYRHVEFWFDGVVAKYRDAQIADRER